MAARIELMPVRSSTILALGYDPELSRAYIEFRTKRARSVYEYKGADAALVAQILYAKSIGTEFGATLKKHENLYPFRKLAAEEVEATVTTDSPSWLRIVDVFRPKGEVTA